MDGKTFARIGAIAFVAAAIEMNRHDDPVGATPTNARPVVGRDPLAAELARCSGIGQAGASDPSCLKAWADNRRRFLGQPAAPSASAAPTTLFPGASNAAELATSAAKSEAASTAIPSQGGGR